MCPRLIPAPGIRIHDPASGTGGFLLAACEYVKELTDDPGRLRRLVTKTRGVVGVAWETVANWN